MSERVIKNNIWSARNKYRVIKNNKVSRNRTHMYTSLASEYAIKKLILLYYHHIALFDHYLIIRFSEKNNGEKLSQ